MPEGVPARFPHVERWLQQMCEPATKVLEAGCGGGQYRNLFTGDQYVGFDVPETWYAPISAPSVFASADALPFRSACFDLIFSVSAFDYFPRPVRVLQEMRRCLRSEGQILIFTYNTATLREIHANVEQLFGSRAVADHHVFTRQDLDQFARESGLTLDQLPDAPQAGWKHRLKRLVRPTTIQIFRLMPRHED